MESLENWRKTKCFFLLGLFLLPSNTLVFGSSLKTRFWGCSFGKRSKKDSGAKFNLFGDVTNNREEHSKEEESCVTQTPLLPWFYQQKLGRVFGGVVHVPPRKTKHGFPKTFHGVSRWVFPFIPISGDHFLKCSKPFVLFFGKYVGSILALQWFLFGLVSKDHEITHLGRMKQCNLW